jgi:hypothetical protein
MRKIILSLTLLILTAFWGEMVPTVSAQTNRPARNTNRNLSVSDDRPIRSVPEPATILLIGSGLIGIAAWRRWNNWE